MGTDIHGRVQRRYRPEGEYEDVGEIERDRNYAVFAMLAGVRNGFGFAGVHTHTPLEPIAEPRGLPEQLGIKMEDWSQYDDPTIKEPKVLKTPFTEGDFGDHSFSWVTLKEVLDWPGWNLGLQRIGYVDREQYERLQREGGTPEHWCGGIGGGGVVTTTEDDVRNLTAPSDWTHVQMSWSTPFRENAVVFRLWLDYLAAKYNWLIERDPGAIRLVFGFDS